MIEMRTSERGALKRCAQQWWWGQVEGLAPKTAAAPLWFGSAVHEGLAAWYQPGLVRGPHPAETFLASLEGDRSVAVSNEEEEAEYMSARELGVAMLNHYVDTYGNDESWFVLATEQTFQVRLPRKKRTLFGGQVVLPYVRGGIRYVGTFDGVYRDESTGEIWLMEHKTAASIRTDHLPLDDQAGSYWALATAILRKKRMLGPNEEIAGIMYNFLRKAPPDDRPHSAAGYHNKPLKRHYIEQMVGVAAMYDDFKNLSPKLNVEDLAQLAERNGFEVFGEVSKVQPPEWFLRWPVYRSRGERAMMVQRIQDEAFFAESYREGWLPVTKTPDKQHCTWCPFRRMCELHEQGDMASVEEFKQHQYVHRDPYAAHSRKSTE